MRAQVAVGNGRGIVRSTVPGDGHQVEGAQRVLGTRPVEPVDELAARRWFDAVIAKHLPALRARATQLCRSHFDADDVVQDSVLRAFRSRDQVGDPARIRSWLLTIVTNTFIDLTRKERKQGHQVELVEGDIPALDPGEPSAWDHITLDDVRAAIDQLPDDVRDTYRMFALEGLDYHAISAAQQIPKATVGTRIFRARKNLRFLLMTEPPRGKGGQ